MARPSSPTPAAQGPERAVFNRGRGRFQVALGVAMAAAVGLPWLVPAARPGLRLFAGLLGWLGVHKALDLWTGAPRDARTRHRTGAFLLWLVMPPPIRWPRSPGERRAHRRQGLLRLARAAAKGVALTALLLLSHHVPQIHNHWALRSFWGLWVGYLVFSGGMDLGTSVPMLWGVHVAESFEAPFLARNPREFWARRWNRWIHGVLRRYVFAPLRRTPRLALVATFVVSALMHEYLVVAALGHPTGEMLAFFALHGLAVLAQRPLSRLARSLHVGPWTARLLHIGWLVVTGPLFLEPVLRIVPLDHW